MLNELSGIARPNLKTWDVMSNDGPRPDNRTIAHDNAGKNDGVGEDNYILPNDGMLADNLPYLPIMRDR
jgi:hypothetical protein